MEPNESTDKSAAGTLLHHLVRNNMRTIAEIRAQARRSRSLQHRIADAVTNFSGHMNFVYLHVVWFVVWIVVNQGVTPMRPFDPYPFGLLTMVVSLEAIFLSTFVLISQNRQSAQSEERADLDLHIDLLAEHEITKILRIVDSIAQKVGASSELDSEVGELEEQLTPEQVLAELRRQS